MQNNNGTETFTEINDGQVTWTANTNDLVEALVRIGYACDKHHGYFALSIPQAGGLSEGDDAYGELCASVYPEELVADSVETITFNPAALGTGRMEVSEALFCAVWDAS